MPILTTVLGVASFVVPLIKQAIQSSEDSVGAGKGDEKKKLAMEISRPLLDKLHKAHPELGALDDETVGNVVELIFAGMRRNRELRETKEQQRQDLVDEAASEGKSVIVVEGGKHPKFKDNVAYPAEFDGTIKFYIKGKPAEE